MMIKNYIKTAWRNIRKHFAFSLINAGGLTLGMASCLMLLLYVSYHLNYDKQFTNINNLYMVENNQPGDGKTYTFAATPGVMAAAIKSDVPGVANAVRMGNYMANGLLTYKDKIVRKNGLFADDGFFNMFSYKFLAGNAASALKSPNSIVITRDLADILFGYKDPMNQVIRRNDKTPLTVTGVIENLPPNESFQFDYVLPFQIFEAEVPWTKTAGWGSNFCQTVVQLKNPAAFKGADAVIRKMIDSHQNNYKAEAMLFPYAKMHLYSNFENGKSVGGMIDQIKLFWILAISILLIACVNFMNLSTARSEERAREVGIRKAVGSSRLSLMWQFIIESVMLSVIALLFAVVLLLLTLPAFNNLLHTHLSIPFDNGYAWLVACNLAIFTGVIAGSYPAFYLSSFQPVKVLKGIFKGGSAALPLRQVLVVLQFGCAVFLITATICIYRQIKFIQDKSIGYDKGNLVEIAVEGNLNDHPDVLINELKRENAISNATTLSQSITQNGSNTWSLTWPGKRADEKVLIDVLWFGYDFLHTAGVKLIEGREFSSQFPADTAGKTVMINQTFAKLMNIKHPVGTVINYGTPYTIVGVYQDFVWGSPYKKIPPMVSGCSNKGNVIAMRLNSNKSISACMALISKKLKALNPAYPPTVNFVDSDFAKKFENEQLLAKLANIFGGLAIIISCLGLFGLAAYAAEQRTKEIGIRKVLGAGISNLVALLSKDFLILVGIAIAFAVPLSIWALNKWLQNYEYRTELSWWIIALAGLITITIALLTVSFQAVKAAVANPVKSLRSE
jgi:ABC-type antimicrobial peptide transport system permease subunit